MDDFDPSIVITKVGNGFVVRGLSAVMNGNELHADAQVFNGYEDLFEFLKEHYNNLERRLEGGQDESRDSKDSGDSIRVLPD